MYLLALVFAMKEGSVGLSFREAVELEALCGGVHTDRGG